MCKNVLLEGEGVAANSIIQLAGKLIPISAVVGLVEECISRFQEYARQEVDFVFLGCARRFDEMITV